MDAKSNLWHIPLVEVVRNNNTDTIIVNQPLTEFLLERPPPTDAIHNIYKQKTQPELVRYYHTAAGFPTKPTWLKAIKNKQYASWPGLSIEAVMCHYPHTEETPKGHSRKSPSNLGSTKKMQSIMQDPMGDEDFYKHITPRPPKKERSLLYLGIYDMKDKSIQKIFTDQTGRFPKKSSPGNQYIMVLIDVNSDAIFVELMKNRTSGKMIRAYQKIFDHLRTAGM
jgi:hypothetical protein